MLHWHNGQRLQAPVQVPAESDTVAYKKQDTISVFIAVPAAQRRSPGSQAANGCHACTDGQGYQIRCRRGRVVAANVNQHVLLDAPPRVAPALSNRHVPRRFGTHHRLATQPSEPMMEGLHDGAIHALCSLWLAMCTGCSEVAVKRGIETIIFTRRTLAIF